MVTIEKAIDILRKKNPDRRIIDLFDFKDFYASSAPTKRWNGNPKEVPSSSGFECVRKSNGETFFYHILDMLNDDATYERLDIKKYLSKEDAEFLKKAKEKFGDLEA